ncbi:MAG: hypothetical protein HOV81_03015 [Kofleriaceae bacterium]|nr:hypothetical protein [Kofleriaceae bacterium]
MAIVLAFAAIILQAFLDLLATGLGDRLVVVGFTMLCRDSRACGIPSARARYRR